MLHTLKLFKRKISLNLQSTTKLIFFSSSTKLLTVGWEQKRYHLIYWYPSNNYLYVNALKSAQYYERKTLSKIESFAFKYPINSPNSINQEFLTHSWILWRCQLIKYAWHLPSTERRKCQIFCERNFSNFSSRKLLLISNTIPRSTNLSTWFLLCLIIKKSFFSVKKFYGFLT